MHCVTKTKQHIVKYAVHVVCSRHVDTTIADMLPPYIHAMQTRIAAVRFVVLQWARFVVLQQVQLVL